MGFSSYLIFYHVITYFEDFSSNMHIVKWRYVNKRALHFLWFTFRSMNHFLRVFPHHLLNQQNGKNYYRNLSPKNKREKGKESLVLRCRLLKKFADTLFSYILWLQLFCKQKTGNEAKTFSM